MIVHVCSTYSHSIHAIPHAGDSVNDDELYEIVSGVMKESDIAKSRKLTYTEFEHVISRAPDFADLFHVTI